VSAVEARNPEPGTRHPTRALFRLAWKESRSARRRLLLYMSSISLGVAALVAIDSFAGNVTRSIRVQSRALLGGDLAFRSGQPWTKDADALLDSLAHAGTPIARVTTFASMGVIPRGNATRLVQVRGVTPEYPLYGDVVTRPASAWGVLQKGANAIVDPAVLITLDAQIGDTLLLGYGRFRIIGTIETVPGDAGISAAIGPRVFVPASQLGATQLLGFGSRAEYEAFAKLPERIDPARWVDPFQKRLEQSRVRIRTVAQNESQLTRSIEEMGKFLGLVGLVALLLGGIGVASGVNAFVARKIDTVAVLRCLGATSGQVLVIYVAQAAVMGLVGAALGAALGVAIQFVLPNAVRTLLPVDVHVTVEPLAVGLGLALGLWVALAFALRPLVALRHVSPLQALRRDADGGIGRMGIRRALRDWPRVAVAILIAASVVLIAATRARSLRETIAMSAGLAGVLALLAASAALVSWGARHALRARWPYVVRQGIANLYRPANQTRAVILALGFGAFLISTLYLVQSNLLRQFTLSAERARGNLVFFDVQDDQVAGVDSVVRASRERVVDLVPIVTMRIASIDGRSTAALLTDSARQGGGWALRREYRSTFRDSLTTSEELVGGKWFGKTSVPVGEPAAEVSLDQGVARELHVKLGDVITWDVQGVKVPTRVTSLREVNWARFEPNFFAVFSPGALESAPKMWVVLANAPDATASARMQRAMVVRYPNVSSIDLSVVRKTIDDVIGKVATAIRFLAIFSLAMAVPVLFSAVAASRRERVREGVLLKTLGATRVQIRRILLAEYAVLGVLGSLTGMLLAFVGAWALLRWVFERPFTPATLPALAIAGAMVLLTVTIGVLSGRDVFRETPMAALRTE
jgi:putative ABC transport system permease protein